MNDFAKTLIFFGVVLIAIGIVVSVFGKIPGLGRFPGDIYVRKGSFTFYFPLTTCLVLSLILTLVFSLFGKK
ncbi:MAG: DUF2905 domain-containing protein [Candidatus Omnitrophica bacterium]|nr:DUF2905 domain-containing protein [Candidatus Omnitrophota bacterium]MDD5671975.1 DUF2905 domain-containing protein [Candidatus Omnitrophota bacterium]